MLKQRVQHAVCGDMITDFAKNVKFGEEQVVLTPAAHDLFF